MGNDALKGMRIYVAAPFDRRGEAMSVAEELGAHGAVITSSWLYTHHSNFESDLSLLRAEAEGDLEDVRVSDVMVVLSYPDEGRGMHFEAGFAFAANIPLVVIGGWNRQIFFLLDDVSHYAKVSDFIADYTLREFEF